MKSKQLLCNNLMRDDRIGGLRQLGEVFNYIESNGLKHHQATATAIILLKTD